MNIEQLREAIAFFDKYDYENAHHVISLRDAAKTLLYILESKEWKIVPVERTESMYYAAYNLRNDDNAHDPDYDSVYQAYLSAAPDFIESNKDAQIP